MDGRLARTSPQSSYLADSHPFNRHQGGPPTKPLLIVKAAVETLAGLALVAFPSMAVSFLTGQGLAEPGGKVLGRIAGVALLALGISCWLTYQESQSRAAVGLIWALLFYDGSVVGILLVAYLGVGLFGIALWPAVLLHSGLGMWSVLCLRKVTRGS